jgi:hypothetical protein
VVQALRTIRTVADPVAVAPERLARLPLRVEQVAPRMLDAREAHVRDPHRHSLCPLTCVFLVCGC